MGHSQQSKNIQFVLKDIENLASELSKPFTKISVLYGNQSTLIEKRRWASIVTLWRADGVGLKIYPKMYDIANMQEAGSLCFDRIRKADNRDDFFKLPDTFSNGTLLQKVILNECGKRIETGIVITAANDAQILLVPNSMPYTLAIRCKAIGPDYFEPEYSIEEYVIEGW